MAMQSSSNYLLVAAIDFGTTYSGYAFSTKAEFKRDPLCICTNQTWNAGTRRLCSLKTPTCLLLGANKEFIAFGYEAEDKFAGLVLDEKHRDYYYFERFKMKLHNKRDLSIDMMLEDKTGKPLAAVDVFSMSIKALKDHLMNQIQTQGADIRPNEIQWVLTVPAIWTDKAKQFMRKSAEKADIMSYQLLIALEPEAASIFYQHLSEHNFDTSQNNENENRYIIVDLGGGTADLTVHEKMDNNSLREVCRAAGGSCGGETVNEAYITMLEDIVKIPNFRYIFSEEYLEDYIDLVRDFELAKRTLKSNTTDTINISIPYSCLDNLCQQHHGKGLDKMLTDSPYCKTISFKGSKMRCSVGVIANLFHNTSNEIIKLITDVLESNDEGYLVKHIVMVGGFSECALIRDKIQKKFRSKTIIVPKDSGLAVLEGAVLFGHQPEYIAVRVMKYTYGISSYENFDNAKHDPKRYVELNGEDLCKNAFGLLIRKNQQVKFGEATEKTFTSTENHTQNKIELYYTANENPVYTDEDGCFFVGELIVDIPEPRHIKHDLKVRITFGKTELLLETEECESGQKYKTTFNML